MSCAEFQNWLDHGRPEPDMREHALFCSPCQRELQAAMEIEQALAVIVPADVTAGFNDAVMHTIRASARPRRRRMLAASGQILADPFVAGSMAMAVVVAWMHEVIAAAAVSISSRAGGVLVPVLGLTISVAILAVAFYSAGEPTHDTGTPVR